jgi:hypothetical protein
MGPASRWTFWYYPDRVKGKAPPAMLLVPSLGKAWAPRYALALYGVRGCQYAGQQDGLPYFEVPGHGVQGLNLAQARACNIARMTELEAYNGGVKRADPR